MAKPKNPSKPKTDWEAARLDYETGLLNFSEIGRKYKITPQSVSMKAKKHGWRKQLANVVKAQADLQLAEELVGRNLPKDSELKAAAIVAAAAGQQYNIAKGHRLKLARLECILDRHFDILETGSFKAKDKNGKDVTGILDVSDSTKLLSVVGKTLKTIIELERESYNMNGTAEDAPLTKVYMDVGFQLTLDKDVSGVARPDDD